MSTKKRPRSAARLYSVRLFRSFAETVAETVVITVSARESRDAKRIALASRSSKDWAVLSAKCFGAYRVDKTIHWRAE